MSATIHNCVRTWTGRRLVVAVLLTLLTISNASSETVDPSKIPVDVFGIISSDTYLYTVPDVHSRSDDALGRFTIVRIDEIVNNGYARIRGMEWYVPLAVVDNINITIINQTYAIILPNAILLSSLGYDDKYITDFAPNHMVAIEGECRDRWVIMVDGVYYFIDKTFALILPSRVKIE